MFSARMPKPVSKVPLASEKEKFINFFKDRRYRFWNKQQYCVMQYPIMTFWLEW